MCKTGSNTAEDHNPCPNKCACCNADYNTYVGENHHGINGSYYTCKFKNKDYVVDGLGFQIDFRCGVNLGKYLHLHQKYIKPLINK